jgi:hypothetical protein
MSSREVTSDRGHRGRSAQNISDRGGGELLAAAAGHTASAYQRAGYRALCRFAGRWPLAI